MNDNELKEMNERNLNGEEHLKNEKKGKLLGIIFLIWFFTSLIAMFVLSEKNPYYMVMVFGQYFLVFGTIVLFSKGDHKWIAILPVLVGLACIIVPFLMLNPLILDFKINWDIVIPLLIISIFIIVGAAMVIFPILRKKKMEKLCTHHVFATIIDHDITSGDSGELYAPIYKYEFNKETYEVCTNVYSNVGVKPVGTIVDLMINPNKPKEFLDESFGFTKGIVIMGIFFLLVSVPMFVLILMEALGIQ